MNMQSSNGNFEKYKSEMLRMYQQKNRPVNSTENNYINNDQDRFYNDPIKSMIDQMSPMMKLIIFLRNK